MSYLERTARKLLPILLEVKKRMIMEKRPKSKVNNTEILETESNDLDPKAQVDMKNILGYLNQGEWTQTLSIGSIMQLQPYTLKDVLESGRNELELTRDSFIQKIAYLAVSYFCYSTEIRFIIQMKEDISFDVP